MAEPVPQHRPLPADSLDCRRNAEAALADQAPLSACAWALLAIAGDVAAIRRTLSK
ncbi:hypothetical protein [Streptomyces sp. MCL20-2]|uniref:hypothetical protein n=1 Tax=Streptomyces sp. MCL20-2 TaxID=2967219 RepID=UPI002965F386|nr:hypothetical protein [Streptomyces sp. MCL20-2]